MATMEDHISVAKAQLIEGLVLLSMSPEEQFRLLPSTVHVADELVSLVLDPLAVLGRRWETREGKIDNLLLRLESTIEAQPPEFFSDASVKESPLWIELRRLARATLDAMGLAGRTTPNLDFISFQPG